ncbi:MAG: RelA/SpoT family protein [Bacteroidetes bacterium]|jgi:GTP pyrophosphokinase|nr:RelA/SpoT family protein [Bacteroidota bacterium]
MAEVVDKAEDQKILEEFKELLNNCYRCSQPQQRELVQKAFDFAFKAHKGMVRKSGEPFILHPLNVAKIVSNEIGLGARSIACAFLHDVVEDTDYTLDDIKYHFDDKIASIIDGLTKISEVFDNNSTIQAENFRKMLLTLSDDVRVILIKLADRLHNMRTLDSMSKVKQMKISSETIYLYAPLAHRLGLYSIKTELEDLSLKYRYPDKYQEIKENLKVGKESRRQFLDAFTEPIKQKLQDNNIDFEISGRPKSIYSIWNKMQIKKVKFEEIYDLLAVRVIFKPSGVIPEKTQCWNIYSLITDVYMPKPERIRDWVSTPKANGYEALHATVMGPYGNWVEVQIRSERMNEIAEKGYAAHWKYKQNDEQQTELDKWIKRIREMLEDPKSDALEFLDEFKMNLFAQEIFVFTPKGDIRTIPKGSIALDFAYEIHSEIGHKAIGAKVNHKLESLHYMLHSGDQVEIITSDKHHSKRDFLNKVVTAKAKQGIKNAIKAETKNRSEKGKNILEAKLAEINLKPSARIFRKLLPAYEVSGKEELYSKIGSGIIELDNLKKILKKNTQNKWIKYWGFQFTKTRKEDKPRNGAQKVRLNAPFIIKEDIDNPDNVYNISKCCNPIPGDDIVSFLNYNEVMDVHKSSCPNAIRLMSSHAERMVTAKWTTHKVLSFLSHIQLNGFDRFGVYNDITTIITKQLNVNIRNINLVSHDGIFEGTIALYIHSVKDLNNLIMNLMKIKGVESVSRVEHINDEIN